MRSGWPGPQRGRQGEATEVRLALDQRSELLVRLDEVLHAGGHRETACAGRVSEHDAQVAMRRQAALEHRAEGLGPARVHGGHDLRLVGDEVRLQRHGHRLVERLDLVADGGDAPVAERDEAPAGDADQAPSDGLPQHAPLEDARAHVQDPLVPFEASPVHIERLVVDQQADGGAVGDADDGLAGLGEAEGPLRVVDGVRLVEAVQVGAAQGAGLTLVERAADAEVAVREGEDGLALREQCEIELGLPDGPRLHLECLVTYQWVASRVVGTLLARPTAASSSSADRDGPRSP